MQRFYIECFFKFINLNCLTCKESSIVRLTKQMSLKKFLPTDVDRCGGLDILFGSEFHAEEPPTEKEQSLNFCFGYRNGEVAMSR